MTKLPDRAPFNPAIWGSEATVPAEQGPPSRFKKYFSSWGTGQSFNGITVKSYGWLFIGITSCGLIVGYLGDWNEAWVIAFSGSAFLLLALVEVNASPRLDIRITLSKTHLHQGEDLTGQILLRNDHKSLSPLTQVVLPVGKQDLLFPLPHIPAGQVCSFEFSLPTTRREVITVGPAKIIRSARLNLLESATLAVEVQQVYVHPNYLSGLVGISGNIRDLEGELSLNHSPSDLIFRDLRPYQAGDDRRHIHWRLSASQGELMVKRYQEAKRPSHLIIVDQALDHYGTQDFELAVEVAASLAKAAAGLHQPLVIIDHDATLEHPQIGQVLDHLSAIALEQDTAAPVKMLKRAILGYSQVGICSMILGPETTIDSLTNLVAEIPMGITGQIFRVDLGSMPKRKQLGNCVIYNLGELSQLSGLCGEW